MDAPLPVVDLGFVAPRFERRVELREFLGLCPGDATTRGIFFSQLCDHVRKEMGRDPPALYEGLGSCRWLPFRSYPLADFLKLAFNASRLLYPSYPVGEGLRRLGWLGYPSLASTMAGRVVLFALGERLDSVFANAANAYRVALPDATVTAMRLGPQHYRLGFRRAYNFLDTYQVGVLEGAVRANGYTPTILVRPGDQRCDADFDVRWR